MTSPEEFSVELRRWRDVRGLSQTKLAGLMGYDRSYVSKVESGAEPATHAFAVKAETVLEAGGALLAATPESTRRSRGTPDAITEGPPTLVVERDEASLHYDGRTYTATQRRLLFNTGTEPVAQYLIRISVDRYPGSPERSNELYREHPLRWEDLQLRALHRGGGPMRWRVQHDRDSVKELWLLFENDTRRFPLYPGEREWIEYSYTVPDTQWGHWFQRTVRLPTSHLHVELDFPNELQPVVWGQETTMTAAALPLRTAIARRETNGRAIFTWSTDHPPLHARYRLEWTFNSRDLDNGDDIRPPMRASDTMRALGIAQRDDPLLQQPATPFTLPEEADDARRLVAQLHATMERCTAVHRFSKGIGIAAPQIGVGRSAALIRTPNGTDHITLLNPRIIEESADTDEQYEGCLSFFDVRGLVPSPLQIQVEHQDIDGQLQITTFDKSLARLVRHEIDHLAGRLYTTRMRPDTDLIPVSQYQGTGHAWRY